MTAEGYSGWMLYHADLMIIHDKDFDAFLRRLEPFFRRMGVTVEELEEATDWMVFAESCQGIAWRDHARVIRTRILSRRPNKNNVTEQRLGGKPFDIKAVAGKIGKEQAS